MTGQERSLQKMPRIINKNDMESMKNSIPAANKTAKITSTFIKSHLPWKYGSATDLQTEPVKEDRDHQRSQHIIFS